MTAEQFDEWVRPAKWRPARIRKLGPRANARLSTLVVFGLVALLYLFDLGRTPVYFGGDEAHFAAVGHSIATTGRNLSGDRMPLFVNLADPGAESARRRGATRGTTRCCSTSMRR